MGTCRSSEVGTISAEGGDLHYCRTLGGDQTPLLVLHGGPGGGSSYLWRLEALADDRDVVFYDQLGAGLSTAPPLDFVWSLQYFVDEVTTVRETLGLDEVHLYGHSWGGWLALEYLIRKPTGVRSLTVSNATASANQFATGVRKLVEALPRQTRQIIEAFADKPDAQDAEYQEALQYFYRRHVVTKAHHAPKLLELQRNNPSYRALMGPHELALTGSMANWNRVADLHRIDVPSLVIAGQRDHAIVACATTIENRLAHAQLVVFEDSAHNPLDEETVDYLALLVEFLRANDQ